MKLQSPLDIALIGTGFRSRTVYRLLFAALHARNVRLVAVCDPVKESADSFAASMGVPAFYSIRDLVRARPMEAAIVCTPSELFHSISCYLSQNGIHHQVEASFCASLSQARNMIYTARERKTTLAVDEQFFRLAYERLAKSIAEVFVNGRQCVALRVYPGRADSVGISLRAQGSDAALHALDVWQLKSIY